MGEDLERLKEKIKRVPGFLRQDEAELLYQLAKRCSGQGVIVEVGSWKGKSTICLALGSKANRKIKVYAVDPHIGSAEHQRCLGKVDTFQEFKKNIKKADLSFLVRPIVTTSKKAGRKFKQPVELIFIDGSHDYQAVKEDFQSWFPKLINGGIIAFHDTLRWPGPRQVVKENLFQSRDFKNIHLVGSITWAQKTASQTAVDRCRNYYVLFLKELRRQLLNLNLPNSLHQLAKKVYYQIQ